MMKFATLVLAVGLAFGQAPAPRAAKKQGAVTLPADAKKIGEGVWEHTDAQGKAWVYKQMPFGLTKIAKADLDARSNVSLPDGMSVTAEAGGKYKFSRRTPFGPVSYVKAEDELSEMERAVVAAMNRKAQTQAAVKQQ